MAGQKSCNLTFVIYSLNFGGAEKNLVTIANLFASANYKVSVVTLCGDPISRHFHLDRRISFHSINSAKKSFGLFSAALNNSILIWKLRRYLKNLSTTHAISFGSTVNIQTFFAVLGTKSKTIGCERVDPISEILSQPWPLLRWMLYRYFKTIVVQTQAMADRMPYLTSPMVIPNPLNLPKIKPSQKKQKKSSRVRIVAAGRLVKQKRFDLLIEALSIAIEENKNIVLEIYGEGPEKKALDDQINKLQVHNFVKLKGFKFPLQTEIESADIFVLSSDYEGFPNVLLEAMSLGLAIVATNCPTGPADMIEHGRNGILVEAGSAKDLGAAIITLSNQSDLRHRLGERATLVSKTFNEAAIFKKWQSVID